MKLIVEKNTGRIVLSHNDSVDPEEGFEIHDVTEEMVVTLEAGKAIWVFDDPKLGEGAGVLQGDIDLDSIRADKKARIKAVRNSIHEAPLLTSDGLTFKTDATTILDAQILIQTLQADLEAAKPVFKGVYPGYKQATGVYADVTIPQFANALQEGALRKSALFATEQALGEAVDAADTKEAILAIGWPE